MTQAVIDNARSISFDRQSEFATSTSIGGQFQYFRKGPIASRLVVELNVLQQADWLDIRADLASGLLGPYDIELPTQIVGPNRTHTITVDGANQDDNTLDISSTSTNTLVLEKGDLIKIAGVDGSYMSLTDVTTNASGDATVSFRPPYSILTSR